MLRIDTKRNSLGNSLVPAFTMTIFSCCKVDELLSQRWEKIKHQKQRAHIKINSYVYIYMYIYIYAHIHGYEHVGWWVQDNTLKEKTHMILKLLVDQLRVDEIKGQTKKKTRRSPCGTPMIQRHMSLCSLFERCHLSWNYRKLSSITIKLSLKYR